MGEQKPEKTKKHLCAGLLAHVKEGKTITNAYAGMPASYATFTLGAHLLENYVNTAEWPETAYSDIADFIVSSWSEAAGL